MTSFTHLKDLFAQEKLNLGVEKLSLGSRSRISYPLSLFPQVV